VQEAAEQPGVRRAPLVVRIGRGWALPYGLMVVVVAVDAVVWPRLSVLTYLVLAPLLAGRMSTSRPQVVACGAVALAVAVAVGVAHGGSLDAQQLLRLGLISLGTLVGLVNQGASRREQSALARAMDTVSMAAQLAAGLEPEEAYEQLARSASTLYAADAVAVYRRYGDDMLAVAQQRGDLVPPLPARLAERDYPRAFAATSELVRAGSGVTPEAPMLEARGLQRLLWLPLVDAGGEQSGSIALAWRRRGPRLTGHELEASRRFADLGARAISGSERVRAQLEVLEQVQALLLSTPPAWAQGFQVGVRYESASSLAQLGGDFYDVIEVDSRGLAFILADARGKGLEASSMAAVLKGAFRSLAGEGAGPARILARLDRLVAREGGEEDFVTALAGRVFPDGRLQLASAGHPLPLGARPRLIQVAAPLGLGTQAVESQGVLRRGQRLICYTDGLIEARDDSGRFVERAKLEEAARSDRLDEALDRLVGVVREHTAGRHDDDLALLGLEYDPDGPGLR
jgi:Stage II sporulation protein E (SpoIIE)